MKTTIGEYLHDLRVQNCMTLTQLGALIGVDSGALSKIENGKKSLDVKCLPKIASTFSIDLKSLNAHFISERIAIEIITHECDESLLGLIEEKIKLIKEKSLRQAELKF